MAKLSRKFHIYISIFFLPVALIYALTGTLYIFGVTDKTGTTTHKIKLESPLPLELEQKIAAVESLLAENGYKMPKDRSLRESRGAEMMGSIKYSVILDVKNGEISVIERNFWSCLVLLHKAKGGALFNVLGAAFGVVLIILYLTGLMATSWCKSHRPQNIALLILGTLATAFAIYFSI